MYTEEIWSKGARCSAQNAVLLNLVHTLEEQLNEFNDS